jgi:hypothetical protein
MGKEDQVYVWMGSYTSAAAPIGDPGSIGQCFVQVYTR